MLYDSDSKFALSTQGPVRGDSFIDPDSYRHILAAFSRGIFDAKRQQRLVRPQHLLPSQTKRERRLSLPAILKTASNRSRPNVHRMTSAVL